MSGATEASGPPRLVAADLPLAGEFPDLLADRLLEEVASIAAYVPLAQKRLFSWALFNLAARLLERDDALMGDIEALDARIRRALFLVVERLVMLFPGFRRHVGAALRTFVALIDEEVILVGVRPLPPAGEKR